MKRARITATTLVALSCLVLLALQSGAPASAVGAFEGPVIVSSLNDSEPGVDVATDGTIYVNAIPGLTVPGPSPSHLWRAGGTSPVTFTLTPPGTRAALPGGGDFDIDVDPVTGAIYGTDLWLGSATVSVSTDKGNTWTANPYSTPVQDRQWIATATGGRVYHATHQIPSGLVVAKSLDGGISYPTSHVAATPVDQARCICPPGTLIAENGGLLGDKVGLIYSTAAGGVKFAKSTNGAVTFSQSTVGPATSADTISAFPVVANAGGNKLVAVWLEVLASSSRVKLSSSTDWGSTWATPRVIVSAGTSLYPWVGARGSKVAVSLFHTSATNTPSKVAASAQWFESYLESTDGGATFSGLVNADATVVKTGPICTDGINCNEDRELGDFQSVTVDTAGRANLVWARSINGSNDTEIRFVRQL
ncbi:MAG: hypothetical protein ABR548_14130 [Actinomycetota bacterium]|nr:hypothetical protein [Actinomycetota bacterium]